MTQLFKTLSLWQKKILEVLIVTFYVITWETLHDRHQHVILCLFCDKLIGNSLWIYSTFIRLKYLRGKSVLPYLKNTLRYPVPDMGPYFTTELHLCYLGKYILQCGEIQFQFGQIHLSVHILCFLQNEITPNNGNNFFLIDFQTISDFRKLR